MEDACLQCFTALQEMGEFGEADLSSMIQAESISHAAYKGAKATKGKGGHSKGTSKFRRRPGYRKGARKGKGKGKHSLEERKKALALLKARTECKIC